MNGLFAVVCRRDKGLVDVLLLFGGTGLLNCVFWVLRVGIFGWHNS